MIYGMTCYSQVIPFDFDWKFMEDAPGEAYAKQYDDKGWKDVSLPHDFIIERVANWFFSTKALYRLPDGTRLYAEVGIHPVGSLNLTASYDGWYLHLGAIKTL